MKLIPIFKNENPYYVYGLDIKIDASFSIDEGLILQNQSTDPLMLFSWDCPNQLKPLCKSYSIPNSNNKIINIKYSQYSSLLQDPDDFLNLEFTLNIFKDKRSSNRPITIKLNKSISNDSKQNNNTKNFTVSKTEIDTDIDLTKFIMIEQNRIGIEDLLFQVTLLNQNLSLEKYKYTWNIPHFKSDDQYLNGINEIYLRVKQKDFLNGVNKIILKITNPTTGQNFYTTYDYEKGFPPYGGNCRVEPIEGYSLLTNFNFNVENWTSSSKLLIYKILFENKSKILFDLSNGGFTSKVFNTQNLPLESKIFLQVTDVYGFSTTVPCLVNIKKNKNLKSLDSLLENVIDMSNKLLLIEIYQTNINSENGMNYKIIDESINMLNIYFENFYLDDFLVNYEKIISTLITITNHKLKDENLNNLLKILNVILKYIDSLMNDVNKIEYIYKILDNLNTIIGDELKSRIYYFLKIYKINLKFILKK